MELWLTTSKESLFIYLFLFLDPAHLKIRTGCYDSQPDTLSILQLVPQKQMSFLDDDGKNNSLDVAPCSASLKNCVTQMGC